MAEAKPPSLSDLWQASLSSQGSWLSDSNCISQRTAKLQASEIMCDRVPPVPPVRLLNIFNAFPIDAAVIVGNLGIGSSYRIKRVVDVDPAVQLRRRKIHPCRTSRDDFILHLLNSKR